jgi:hypothetical protein
VIAFTSQFIERSVYVYNTGGYVLMVFTICYKKK